ncbi:hypothetical protein [Streptomyces sp. SID5910]|uniref:hypothetical protein n=1 Tax=Streptomyces sp. SID5910 TaxID=2690312 RepID=UPI00136E9317|nr:hypothetical protein [Streptomyces sp. SID5910]MYR43088.1 hypothetical protein [Streptomyces sp. SID5910]
MSALYTITAYILAHYADDDPAYVARIRPQLEAEAQELYDAVAHELAACTRAEKDSWPQATQRVAIACVANRIDPEVP